MKRILTLCLSLVALFALTACGGSNALEVSGSTSVAPLMDKLAGFYQEATGNEVNVTSDGSSAGIRAATEGVSDIGMSSRAITADELAQGITAYTIAVDAIGVIVNPANDVTNLTTEQLTQIFSGEITNWNQVGGADLPIVVISREAGSGTRSAWEENLHLDAEDGTSKVDGVPGLIIGSSTGAVLENVSNQTGAIGYLSIESANDSVRLLSVNGVAPSEATIVNGTYPISREFILVWNAENNENEKVQDFLTWMRSAEGQEHIRNAGYIPASSAN